MELKKRITPIGKFDCNVFPDESFKRKDEHGLGDAGYDEHWGKSRECKKVIPCTWVKQKLPEQNSPDKIINLKFIVYIRKTLEPETLRQSKR